MAVHTTMTPYMIGNDGHSMELLIDWEGAAAGGAVGSLLIDSFPGWMIYEALTNPGSTAPTPSYDITLIDAHGIDIAGGQLTDRHTSTSERVCLIDPPIIRTAGFTVTFAGQSVNSATGQLSLILVRV